MSELGVEGSPRRKVAMDTESHKGGLTTTVFVPLSVWPGSHARLDLDAGGRIKQRRPSPAALQYIELDGMGPAGIGQSA